MKRITSFLLAIVLFAGLVLTAAPTAHAASEMTVSDALVEILKNEEGFSAKPYWDYGQYTVGYGTRCPDDMLEEYKTNGISKEDAEVLLRNYLAGTESTINKKFIDKYGLTLSQNQFDALITFSYNCGTGWINKTGDVFFNAVKNGATGSELINAFTLWCSAGGQILPGLVRRRLCEANMYLNNTYSNTKPSNYGFVYYNANGGSVSYRIQGYNAADNVAPAYTPTYSGHTFQGWYTEKTGGSKVTVLTAELSGDTLYARWDGDSTQQETTTTPAAGVSVKVTATDVNLRKGPGTNYGIVGMADKGDVMVITETASGSGYEWGKAGEKWIALKFTDYATAVKEQEKTPEETKPEETKPEESKPEETKPEETKPEETKPEETKPEETKPQETTPEETKVTGTIKANGGLALRKGPGTGYERIKYLANGSKVTILEQKKAGSMTWGRISEGWISMTYVVLDKTESKPEATEPTAPETTEPTKPEATEPEATEPAAAQLTGTIKAGGGLALRKGPGLGYARIKYIPNGTKVTILEQKKADNMTWGKISEGWISMNYVVLDQAETKPEATEPETTEPTKSEATEPETTAPTESKGEQTTITGTVKADGGLAVRGGAGTNYAVKKYIYNGSKVTVTEVKDVNGTKWGKVSEGWICMDYVVSDSQQSTSNGDSKTVIADCLRVRKTPSTSAAIVGYYYQNAKVEILETQAVDGTTWGRTAKGWISMDYVK